MSSELQYIIILRGRTSSLDTCKFGTLLNRIIYPNPWYTTPCVEYVHYKALQLIIKLNALEHAITNSSILLATSIPIYHRSHCITPTEQRKREWLQDTNKILQETKCSCALTQSAHDKELLLSVISSSHNDKFHSNK